MAQTAMMQEEIEVPDGGIAELVMDDQTADEVYGADEEEVPSGGIAQFASVAEQMAAMGREGDNILGHLETGELVIPRKFLEENEEFKGYVMAFFEGQGVDPERYIAGSDSNSINPDTGMAEFFFKKLFKGIKKVVKKVGKAVKKVVKKVVNVVKKVAPVVLPVVGSMVFGPVFGAAAGSGIATLLNGGNIKDALKSALVSGAGGALTAGISGAVSGAGFGAGVKAAINPANITQGFQSLGTAAKNMSFKDTGIGFKTMKYGMAGEKQIAEKLAMLPSTDPQLRLTTSGDETGIIESGSGSGKTIGDATDAVNSAISDVKAGTTVSDALTMPEGSGSFGSNIKDAFTPGGKGFVESMGDAFLPSGPSAGEIIKAGFDPSLAAGLAESAAPGVIKSALPLVGAGVGALALTGGFKKPPQEDPGLVEYAEDGTPITGEDKIAEDPGKYLIGELQPGTTLDPNTGNYVVDTTNTGLGAGPYEVASSYALDPSYRPGGPGGPFQRPTDPRAGTPRILPYPNIRDLAVVDTFAPPMRAAEGGQVYPRRNGGIMPNEGVPNQDSVRALLMPGEFVMTTDAVKGLGGGSMNQGINNMYSVMRNLESRGRQTA
jgi:hypothetical protein